MWSPSRAAKERIAKRRAGTGTSINMWPFAGVMVAILFLFISDTAPHHRHAWFPVDLPQSTYAAAEPRAMREDAIRIALTRDGSIYFRNAKVPPEGLPDLIRKAVQEGSERKVYLAVDARSKYGDTKAVVELIGQAGIRDVTFLADPVPSGASR